MAFLAQVVEQQPSKLTVAGSNPVECKVYSSVVEHRTFNPRALGSNPNTPI